MLATVLLDNSRLVLYYAISIIAFYFVSTYISAWIARFKHTKYQEKHDCEDPSKLPTVPGIGSWINKFALLRSSGDELLDKVFPGKYDDYGPTHAIFKKFLPKVIHTVDPKILHAITTSDAQSYTHPPARRGVIYPLFQRGIVTTEGEEHHHNRKAAQRHMKPKQIRDVLRNEPDVQRLFESIGSADNYYWTRELDVLEIFSRITLDMTTSYLTGTDADARASALRQDQVSATGKSSQLSDDASIAEVCRVLLGWHVYRRKLGSLCWLADTRTYRRACRIFSNRFQDIINAANDIRKDEYDDHTVLEALLADTKDPELTKEIIMDLFIAGQAMVGTTASWLFALLAEHPEVVKDIRSEVLENFGTEKDPRQPFTWDALQSCETLQNAIHETLRLYPLLPAISRTAAVNTVLPSGGGEDGASPIAVRRGTTVMANVYIIHRQEELWGADADKFRPQRWQGRKTGPEYMPFGSGKRRCPGQELSYTQLSYLTARILQRYCEVKAPAGNQNLSKLIDAIMRPRLGVKLKFKLAA